MWIIPTMGFVESLGYGIRIVSQEKATLTPYIVSVLCILMAPIAMALVNYIVAGRVLRVTGKSLRVFGRFNMQPDHIAKIFFWGDIACFMLQGAGGGLLAIANEAVAKTGNAVVLLGLSVQLMFFLTFMWILHRIYSEPSFGVQRVPSLRTIFWGLRLTVICLLVRNVFRLIEFASFPDGPAYTTEWAFYAFETLPIFISFVFYCVFHFGRLLECKSDDPHWIKEYRAMNPSQDKIGNELTPDSSDA